MYQRDSYVYNPGLTFTYSGQIVDSFRPSVSVSSDVCCDFSDSNQYEVDSRIILSGALNSLLSLSCTYSLNYQSIVPPENESQLNTSTRASVNFHF